MRPSKTWVITLICLVILTALFDSVIIGLHIVQYDHSKILGVFIGLAPIEDFFYALFACVMIPIIWNNLSLTKGHHARKD
jgi:lycopene cyclase domain-containing protein